jgi:hypothetical protein
VPCTKSSPSEVASVPRWSAGGALHARLLLPVTLTPLYTKNRVRPLNSALMQHLTSLSCSCRPVIFAIMQKTQHSCKGGFHRPPAQRSTGSLSSTTTTQGRSPEEGPSPEIRHASVHSRGKRTNSGMRVCAVPHKQTVSHHHHCIACVATRNASDASERSSSSSTMAGHR